MADRSPHAPARILVAEDHDGLRHAITAALRTAGHEVYAAASGAEALGFVAELPAFDLLVTNHELGDMLSLPVIEAVAERSPGARVLMVTGSSEKVPRGIAAERGWDFLVKPVRLAALREAVDTLLARGGVPGMPAEP